MEAGALIRVGAEQWQSDSRCCFCLKIDRHTHIGWLSNRSYPCCLLFQDTYCFENLQCLDASGRSAKCCHVPEPLYLLGRCCAPAAAFVAGDHLQVLELIDQMSQRQLAASPALIPCLLESLLACSRWGNAARLLSYCNSNGAALETSQWSLALQECARCGDWSSAYEVRLSTFHGWIRPQSATRSLFACLAISISIVYMRGCLFRK